MVNISYGFSLMIGIFDIINITYTFDTYHEIDHENYSAVGSYCRAMISIYIIYYIRI